MSDKTANHRLWVGAIRSLRQSKRPQVVKAERLYMAFAMAMNEAHTRGRVYTLGGEKALPGDEFNATQAACERVFFAELRKATP